MAWQVIMKFTLDDGANAVGVDGCSWISSFDWFVKKMFFLFVSQAFIQHKTLLIFFQILCLPWIYPCWSCLKMKSHTNEGWITKFTLVLILNYSKFYIILLNFNDLMIWKIYYPPKRIVFWTGNIYLLH